MMQLLTAYHNIGDTRYKLVQYDFAVLYYSTGRIHISKKEGNSYFVV